MLGIEKVPVSVPNWVSYQSAARRSAAVVLLCFSAGTSAEIITGTVVGIRDGDTFVLLDDSHR